MNAYRHTFQVVAEGADPVTGWSFVSVGVEDFGTYDDHEDEEGEVTFGIGDSTEAAEEDLAVQLRGRVLREAATDDEVSFCWTVLRFSAEARLGYHVRRL